MIFQELELSLVSQTNHPSLKDIPHQ